MVESAASVERVFAVDELFCSTTDAGGRIRRASSIFMHLSGFPRGALLGRAHNRGTAPGLWTGTRTHTQAPGRSRAWST